MAQYGRQTEKYEKVIRVTDEYGNPITHPGGGLQGTDTTATHGMATGGIATHTMDKYGTTGNFGTHKTDQYGTTGAHKTDEYGSTGTTGAYGTDQYGSTGTTGAYRTDEYDTTGTTGAHGVNEREHHEKKGVMEKIKEKLPGHHSH